MEKLRTHCSPVLGHVGPILVLLLCFGIFSGYTVLAKIALLGGTNPLVLAFLRELIALTVLLPAMVYSERRKPVELRRYVPSIEDSGNFMVLGAVMVYGVQLISALALSRVSTLNYALLAPLVPVLTTTLALLTGFEMFRRDTWPSWLKVGGILVAVAGAVVTAFGAIGHASSAGLDAATVITGNILLLTNKLCIAVYPLLEKRLFARGYSPVFVVAWGYATGSVLTLLAVIPCTLTAKAWTVPAAGWAAILYAGCLSSGFNYAAMAYVRDQGDAGIRSQQTPRFRPSSQVNRRTSPVLVMAFYPSQSLFTPLLSWALLGTGVSAEEGVGGAVIVVGEWGAHGGAHGGGQPAHAPAVAGAGLLGVAAAKWAEGARRPAAVAEPSDASGAAETPGLSDAAAAAVAAATAGGDVTVDVVVDPLAVAAARRERTDAGAPPDVLTTTRGGIRGSGAVGAYFGVRDDDDDEGRTAATVRARGPPG